MVEVSQERLALEAVSELVATMDVKDIGERIGTHAVEVVRELSERGDVDLEQETVVAAISNVQAILRALPVQELTEQGTATKETLTWVSTLVQRGVGSAVIPRCYTVGQAVLDLALREAVWALDLPPEQRWKLANDASQFLFGYVEKVLAELIEHYERERERWVRGADSVRTELVLNMIEGRSFDAPTASATLHYELDRSHMALLVWGSPSSAEPPSSAQLRQAAAGLARRLGGTDLLVVPAGASVVWAWAAGPGVLDAGDGPLEVDPSMLAAVGSCASGPEGFARSHREARDARRMAGLLSRRAGSVVRYETVALGALLTRDGAAAAQFVRSELGELASNSDTNCRLRATLTALFEEGMSWGRTAKRLGIHQNTVMYRARQAEELLGRSLTGRRLELEAALRLAEVQDGLMQGSEVRPF